MHEVLFVLVVVEVLEVLFPNSRKMEKLN